MNVCVGDIHLTDTLFLFAKTLGINDQLNKEMKSIHFKLQSTSSYQQ